MRAFYEAHRGRLSAAAAQGRGEGSGGGGGGGVGDGGGDGGGGADNATTTLPSDFVVLCANPRTHWSGRGGVSVLQLVHAQSEARVEVRVREAGAAWQLATSGARRLRIVLPRGAAARRPRALVVDGAAIDVAPLDDTLHLCSARGASAAAAVWVVCFRGKGAAASVAADGVAAASGAAEAAGGEWAFERTERGPHNTGPMRLVTAAPFAIVYGTQSDSPAATEALLRGAQLLSQGHVSLCRAPRARCFACACAVRACAGARTHA
jgi:hypothetical protein